MDQIKKMINEDNYKDILKHIMETYVYNQSENKIKIINKSMIINEKIIYTEEEKDELIKKYGLFKSNEENDNILWLKGERDFNDKFHYFKKKEKELKEQQMNEIKNYGCNRVKYYKYCLNNISNVLNKKIISSCIYNIDKDNCCNTPLNNEPIYGYQQYCKKHYDIIKKNIVCVRDGPLMTGGLRKISSYNMECAICHKIKNVTNEWIENFKKCTGQNYHHDPNCDEC